MLNLKQIILLSVCLTILFVVLFVHGQETQTVLKPNQLVTFSLAPGQEKVFVLQMKKGDFAGIESLAGVGLNLSFEIYDPARKELLEESRDRAIEESKWFVAPRDGDFILVSKLEKHQYPEISDAQKISIQYNNKLPTRTKLDGIRKVNGFDVKIMRIPRESYGFEPVFLLIEKNGQLQEAMRLDKHASYFSFADDITLANSAKEKRSIQLIKATVDKTGDGIPDIMINYEMCGASGRFCSTLTYVIDLGDTVKISHDEGLLAIGKNPKGGLLFEVSHPVYLGSAVVILEFRNGIFRPNFELMKKPPPSLAVLRSKAQKFRPQLSLKPYKGIDNDDSFLYKEGRDYQSSSFADVILDLIFSGNEELAWQFLDLIWPPQKQGKALFIRDFKKQLLESHYWKMILEDSKK